MPKNNKQFKLKDRSCSLEYMADLIGHLTDLREDAGNPLRMNLDLVEKTDKALALILDEFNDGASPEIKPE